LLASTRWRSGISQLRKPAGFPLPVEFPDLPALPYGEREQLPTERNQNRTREDRGRTRDPWIKPANPVEGRPGDGRAVDGEPHKLTVATKNTIIDCPEQAGIFGNVGSLFKLFDFGGTSVVSQKEHTFFPVKQPARQNRVIMQK